jgi:hypothetical protein
MVDGTVALYLAALALLHTHGIEDGALEWRREMDRDALRLTWYEDKPGNRRVSCVITGAVDAEIQPRLREFIDAIRAIRSE